MVDIKKIQTQYQNTQAATPDVLSRPATKAPSDISDAEMHKVVENNPNASYTRLQWESAKANALAMVDDQARMGRAQQDVVKGAKQVWSGLSDTAAAKTKKAVKDTIAALVAIGADPKTSPASMNLSSEQRAIAAKLQKDVDEKHWPQMLEGFKRMGEGVGYWAVEVGYMHKDAADAAFWTLGTGVTGFVEKGVVPVATAIGGGLVVGAEWVAKKAVQAKDATVAGYHKAVEVTSEGIEKGVKAAKAGYNKTVEVTADGIEKAAKAIDKGANAVKKFGNDIADSVALAHKEVKIAFNESVAKVSASMSKFFSAISSDLAADAKAANARAQQARLQPAN